MQNNNALLLCTNESLLVSFWKVHLPLAKSNSYQKTRLSICVLHRKKKKKDVESTGKHLTMY